mgnify:CR=1 FL=1
MPKSARSSTRPYLCFIGNVMLSSTFSHGSRVGRWNTMPISSRGSVTGTPKIDTVPAVGRMSPATRRRIVDLPHPDGPMIDTNSWRCSARSTSLSAVTGAPPAVVKVCPTPDSAITTSRSAA